MLFTNSFVWPVSANKSGQSVTVATGEKQCCCPLQLSSCPTFNRHLRLFCFVFCFCLFAAHHHAYRNINSKWKNCANIHFYPASILLRSEAFQLSFGALKIKYYKYNLLFTNQASLYWKRKERPLTWSASVSRVVKGNPSQCLSVICSLELCFTRQSKHHFTVQITVLSHANRLCFLIVLIAGNISAHLGRIDQNRKVAQVKIMVPIVGSDRQCRSRPHHNILPLFH